MIQLQDQKKNLNEEKQEKRQEKTEQIELKQEGLKQETTKKQPNQASKEEKKKPLLDDFTKKELAKIGMTLSMGTLVLTSFSLKSKLSKNAHIIAGAALVGFSFWHNSLYTDKK